MILLKNTQHLRLFVVLGISLVTTLALLGGTIVLHAQGFTPFATTAHAASSTTTCAATKGTQQALCEHQDPVAQGCVIDTEILDLQTVVRENKPIGEVDLRYSPTCKTYWLRTQAFVTTQGVFKAIHAILLFHNHTQEDIVGTPTVNPLRAYVVWTDMTVAPILPHAGSAQFDLFSQSQPITVPLKE
ncbi:DUF2690 domain-containing protein [Ktedonobacteria bacterium brp13]|nr:DUF2690 domain-containing protein [Ktedonobacteria bacterium brp13]